MSTKTTPKAVTALQIKHLTQRLDVCRYPLQSLLTAKTRQKEPAAVRTARKVVAAFDQKQYDLSEKARFESQERISEVRALVLFADADTALAAVVKLEKEVKK